MIIGCALFYSGLTQRGSALTQLSLHLLIFPPIFILWLFVGYSLCYSPTATTRFLGNFHFVGLRNMEESLYVSARVAGIEGSVLPRLSHVAFEGLLACFTAALTFACIIERGRMKPLIVFAIPWSLVVYYPVVYWEWNAQGWMHNDLKILDYAGGAPIHIVAGCTSLVYSFLLGHRPESVVSHYRNSNSGFIVIGTAFLAVGWLGFNAGCTLGVSFRTFLVVVNSLTSMCMASISWSVIDYVVSGGDFSVIGFCSGCVAGLVCITPAAGYVPFWASFIFGCLGGVACNLGTRIKFWLRVDDPLDIFAVHTIGGVLGDLLVGIFADRNIALLGGETIKGGWLNQNYVQFAYQIVGSIVVVCYSTGVSFILLYCIDKVPGFKLAVEDESILMEGSDGYVFSHEYISDYVEFIRRLDPRDFEHESASLKIE